MRAEIIGTLDVIGDTKSFGDNGFTKRDFVITESDTKFPNPVKLSLKKDNCSLLDKFKKGDKVKVTFSIDGRSWKKPDTGVVSWFVDLTAFKIQAAEGEGDAPDVPPPAEPDESINLEGSSEELPF